jgi:hypothetical protein
MRRSGYPDRLGRRALVPNVTRGRVDERPADVEAFIERLAAVQAENAEPEQAEGARAGGGSPSPIRSALRATLAVSRRGCLSGGWPASPSRLPLADVPYRGAARRVAYRTPELRW